MTTAFHEGKITLGYALFPELAAAGMSADQQLQFARFRFWRILLPVAVWYSFHYLGRLNWGICLPWLIKDLGINRVEAGIPEAALLWGYAATTFLHRPSRERSRARLPPTLGGLGTSQMKI